MRSPASTGRHTVRPAPTSPDTSTSTPWRADRPDGSDSASRQPPLASGTSVPDSGRVTIRTVLPDTRNRYACGAVLDTRTSGIRTAEGSSTATGYGVVSAAP